MGNTSKCPKARTFPTCWTGPPRCAFTYRRQAVGRRSPPDFGLHAYVADAASESDLDTLAQFVIQRSSDVLPVGASGFGRALARALGSRAPVRQLNMPLGLLLFVVGSRQQESAAQIAALRAAGADEIGVPIGMDEDVEALINRMSGDGTAPLLVVRPELTEPGRVPALEIAGRIGRAAAAIVRRRCPSAIVMAGGDTAAACLAALKAKCLHVRGELHDGIAFSTMLSDFGEMPLFTKSGSFGSPNTWTLLADQLKCGSVGPVGC